MGYSLKYSFLLNKIIIPCILPLVIEFIVQCDRMSNSNVTVHASCYESPSVQWFRRRTKFRRFLLCPFLLYITLKDLLQVSAS